MSQHPGAMPGPDLLQQPEWPIIRQGRPAWQPGYADVAKHVINYTRDGRGQRLGTFTPDTALHPDEVARCIYDSTDEVAGYCGAIPDVLVGFAKATAAIGAAGNAVRDLDERLSDSLMEEYKRRLESLSQSVARDNKRGPDGALPVYGTTHEAMHSFPAPFQNGGMRF